MEVVRLRGVEEWMVRGVEGRWLEVRQGARGGLTIKAD